MEEFRPKNRRKNLIVDKKFQFKVSLFFITVALITTITLVSILAKVHINNQNMLGDLFGEIPQNIQTILSFNKIILIIYSILFFILISMILFLVGLYYGQKIIGPLMRISKHLEKVTFEKKNIIPIKFRLTDYLHHVKDIYNLMLEKVTSHRFKRRVKYETILQNLSIVENIIAPLNSEISFKEERNKIFRELENY